MKCVLNVAAMLLILSNLLGCASPSGAVRNASPISTGTPVSLDNVFVETSSSVGDGETERRLLNELIISGLKETEIFGNVSGKLADVGSGSGLKVRVEIREIKKVSESARVWAGALAGQARLLI